MEYLVPFSKLFMLKATWREYVFRRNFTVRSAECKHYSIFLCDIYEIKNILDEGIHFTGTPTDVEENLDMDVLNKEPKNGQNACEINQNLMQCLHQSNEEVNLFKLYQFNTQLIKIHYLLQCQIFLYP